MQILCLRSFKSRQAAGIDVLGGINANYELDAIYAYQWHEHIRGYYTSWAFTFLET